jgi:hypothetical protein
MWGRQSDGTQGEPSADTDAGAMRKNSLPKTKSGSKQTALAPQAAAAFAPPIKVAYLGARHS